MHEEITKSKQCELTLTGNDNLSRENSESVVVGVGHKTNTELKTNTMYHIYIFRTTTL